MKDGWTRKKLSELFTIRPQKKQAKEKLNDNDEISFVPMKCLNVDDRNLTLNQTRTLKDVYGGYTYFEDHDVLLAKITPCFENGKVGIARNLKNGIGFGSSEFIVFRSEGKVIPEYLYYYLSQESFRQEGKAMMAGAVGHKRISKEFIKDYQLPFPESIQEQKRIVAILDEALVAVNKAKANAEKNLANSKELFENYLNGIFANPGEDWEPKKLGEVCDVIGGGTPSKAIKKYYDGNIHWATVRDMKSDIISDTEHKITFEAVKNSSTNVIPKGNVVIATRVGLGKICLIENDTAINQDLRGVIPRNQKVLSVAFLYRWLKSVSKKIIEEGTGATVKGVKLPFIKCLIISIPPTNEQELIVSKFDSLSAEV